MTDKAEQTRFEVAVLAAAYQHKLGPLAKLLRDDCPITAKDKLLLADFVEGKLAPKRGRGRPREPLFSPTWKLQQAVAQVRDLQKRRFKRSDTIEQTIIAAKLRGEDLEKRRDEIIEALDRGTKKGRTK